MQLPLAFPTPETGHNSPDCERGGPGPGSGGGHGGALPEADCKRSGSSDGGLQARRQDGAWAFISFWLPFRFASCSYLPEDAGPASGDRAAPPPDG